MAVIGHGIAWLPESAILGELRQGTLVALPDLPEPEVEIRLYRSPQKSRPTVDRFWTALQGDYPAAS